jgi:hypothetical protein
MMSRKSIIKIALLGLVCFIGVGCGDESSDKKEPPVQSQGPGPQGAHPVIGDPNSGASGSGNPQLRADWNAIKGEYTGSLEKGGYVSNYTLVIGEKIINGAIYGTAEFNSSGNLGQISFQSFISSGGFNGGFNQSNQGMNQGLSYATYTFVSNPVSIPQFSNSKVSLELVAILRRNGSESLLERTPSSIHFKDCAFSMTTRVCTNPMTGLIAKILGKK